MTAPIRYICNLVSRQFDDKTAAAATAGKSGKISKGKSATNGKRPTLLKAQSRKRKTLVLDLDETLIRTSYDPIPNPDFVVKVEGQKAYVKKRPGVDRFLNSLKDKYELVLFTASAGEYAEPVLNFLDVNRVFSARLFREACTFVGGAYVKDLSRLGRDLSQVMIIDNLPISYSLQPENGLPIASFLASSIPMPILLHGYLGRRQVCIKSREF
ncbi:Carboxy-terminal domain RNA polymerase II polypeptide A smallphosphatase 1 [Pelomyxa schiedti]|nr:Carboxy-terminal domain RNA polymerase II polypeptide A smallphosphatase 1 [Pelomyxa schiedti]